MQVRVYRLRHQGIALDRAQVRQTLPSTGELEMCLRLTGQGTSWNVYLAVLMRPDASYVITCLDRSRVIAVRGRWLKIEGLEIIPRGSSVKRLATDTYPQEWWCCVEVHIRLGWLQPYRAPRLAMTNERSQKPEKT